MKTTDWSHERITYARLFPARRPQRTSHHAALSSLGDTLYCCLARPTRRGKRRIWYYFLQLGCIKNVHFGTLPDFSLLSLLSSDSTEEDDANRSRDFGVQWQTTAGLIHSVVQVSCVDSPDSRGKLLGRKLSVIREWILKQYMKINILNEIWNIVIVWKSVKVY